eukprot:TRINITY_DN2110_c3_g1_i1.p1 TRINITY_DN2110_c3_g1~~TRINITY_DN2110_c3_g1_i1.p1  ORF type:complete len:698 (+),score=184.27 TRINITY_DN2110_c3_g1_i1:56-2095(+)
MPRVPGLARSASDIGPASSPPVGARRYVRSGRTQAHGRAVSPPAPPQLSLRGKKALCRSASTVGHAAPMGRRARSMSAMMWDREAFSASLSELERSPAAKPTSTPHAWRRKATERDPSPPLCPPPPSGMSDADARLRTKVARLERELEVHRGTLDRILAASSTDTLPPPPPPELAPMQKPRRSKSKSAAPVAHPSPAVGAPQLVASEATIATPLRAVTVDAPSEDVVELKAQLAAVSALSARLAQERDVLAARLATPVDDPVTPARPAMALSFATPPPPHASPISVGTQATPGGGDVVRASLSPEVLLEGCARETHRRIVAEEGRARAELRGAAAGLEEELVDRPLRRGLEEERARRCALEEEVGVLRRSLAAAPYALEEERARRRKLQDEIADLHAAAAVDADAARSQQLEDERDAAQAACEELAAQCAALQTCVDGIETFLVRNIASAAPCGDEGDAAPLSPTSRLLEDQLAFITNVVGGADNARDAAFNERFQELRAECDDLHAEKAALDDTVKTLHSQFAESQERHLSLECEHSAAADTVAQLQRANEELTARLAAMTHESATVCCASAQQWLAGKAPRGGIARAGSTHSAIRRVPSGQLVPPAHPPLRCGCPSPSKALDAHAHPPAVLWVRCCCGRADGAAASAPSLRALDSGDLTATAASSEDSFGTARARAE